jgi:hypothetical protein
LGLAICLLCEWRGLSYTFRNWLDPHLGRGATHACPSGLAARLRRPAPLFLQPLRAFIDFIAPTAGVCGTSVITA